MEYKMELVHRIGGSAQGALMNVDKYKTKIDIYHECLYGSDFKGNIFTIAGNILEPVIAQEFSKREKKTIFKGEKIQVKDYEFLVAVPDYTYINENLEKCVLECKSIGRFANLDYSHYLQLQWYMGATQSKEGCLAYIDREVDIANIYPHKEIQYSNFVFNFLYFEYDSEIFEKMLGNSVKFYEEHLLPRIPPEPQTLEDIPKIYPVSSKNRIEAMPDIYSIFLKNQEIKTKIKELTREKEGYDLLLRKEIKDNKMLFFEGTKLLSRSEYMSFDFEKFRMENAELYEKYKTKKVISFR